jgi:hypothetical protein
MRLRNSFVEVAKQFRRDGETFPFFCEVIGPIGGNEPSFFP